MDKLTRRGFLAISCIPIVVLEAAARAAASSNDAGLSVLNSAMDTPDLAVDEGFATSEQCPQCGGLGAITCPACDGTGLWTEASESAGLYQREAARATGHCAWCNDWGEAMCPDCSGIGVVPTNR